MFTGAGEGSIGFESTKEFLDLVFSGLMVIGLDNGEGFASLLLASEEPRGGMLTSLASFFKTGVACDTGLGAMVTATSRFDCQSTLAKEHSINVATQRKASYRRRPGI